MATHRPVLLGARLLAAWTLCACRSAAPTADAGAWRSTPPGTVSAFHRVSQGSYGSTDGRIRWAHGTQPHAGRTDVAAVSPQAGTHLDDPETHRIAHVLTPAGQPAMGCEPPIGPRFPMAVGQAWTDEHRVTRHARGTTIPLRVSDTVEALESVTVPAGTFQAFRLRITDSPGEQTVQWGAPAQGHGIVKRVLDRPASHPQRAGHLEGVLVEVRRPG